MFKNNGFSDTLINLWYIRGGQLSWWYVPEPINPLKI